MNDHNVTGILRASGWLSRQHLIHRIYELAPRATRKQVMAVGTALGVQVRDGHISSYWSAVRRNTNIGHVHTKHGREPQPTSTRPRQTGATYTQPRSTVTMPSKATAMLDSLFITVGTAHVRQLLDRLDARASA